MILKDLSNKKFHYLTVLKRIGSNRQGSALWLCRCDCGVELSISSDHLTRSTGSVKSCGCYRRTLRGRLRSDWKGLEDISGNWWYNHVERERNQKDRARVPVDLTKEQAWAKYIEQDKKCALSNQLITISNDSFINTASIDRIDSSKGYTLDNIQWVHKHLNFMKRTYSQEYFIQMCMLVADNFRKGST